MSNPGSSFLILNKIEAKINVDIFIVPFIGSMMMVTSQKGEMFWYLLIGGFSD